MGNAGDCIGVSSLERLTDDTGGFGVAGTAKACFSVRRAGRGSARGVAGGKDGGGEGEGDDRGEDPAIEAAWAVTMLPGQSSVVYEDKRSSETQGQRVMSDAPANLHSIASAMKIAMATAVIGNERKEICQRADGRRRHVGGVM